MSNFICPDQINRDYFTVDDNGKIIPKEYPSTERSVLGDAVGSVPTVITTNTPIEVSTNPSQAGVLTDGSKIVVPQDKMSLPTYNYDYDSGFLSVNTNIAPSYNTVQHNHWSNTYTPPSFIVPAPPTGYTYYIVGHLYTIIANQSYYNCSLSNYIDLFVNGIQQSRGHITQLPNEEVFYDGDVNNMIQDLNTGVNTISIEIDSRKVIGWINTAPGGYTDHSLLMRIKAKILLRKL